MKNRRVQEDTVRKLKRVRQTTYTEGLTPFQQEMIASLNRPFLEVPDDVRERGEVANWAAEVLLSAK